ncbi:MAG: 4Fe-4S ferredoxin [Caldimicrobium thiodismutans]|uniref:4Fe-4S ferredoxin n=1 Tax=Caldimicrobium thiodismutans TaxID=1653476 RepID=A0A2N7PKT3_9BACT|nr:MAG: 4Fe-4S ferredoxin [Caldimicrobium thiodismutans]
MNYTIIHLVEKCTGCEECVKACAEGHEGLSNCRIFQVGSKFAYFACLQCKKPQCASACPVSALVRKGEVVAFYKEICVGCKNCMEACPWGVPRFNFQTGTIGKCDLCIERVKRGEKPYCVSACPNGALIIKELKAEKE